MHNLDCLKYSKKIVEVRVQLRSVTLKREVWLQLYHTLWRTIAYGYTIVFVKNNSVETKFVDVSATEKCITETRSVIRGIP